MIATPRARTGATLSFFSRTLNADTAAGCNTMCIQYVGSFSAPLQQYVHFEIVNTSIYYSSVATKGVSSNICARLIARWNFGPSSVLMNPCEQRRGLTCFADNENQNGHPMKLTGSACCIMRVAQHAKGWSDLSPRVELFGNGSNSRSVNLGVIIYGVFGDIMMPKRRRPLKERFKKRKRNITDPRSHYRRQADNVVMLHQVMSVSVDRTHEL